MTTSLGKAINNNCIDCHMPKQVSKSITFSVAGKLQFEPYYLRSHHIAIYPEETNKVISEIRNTVKQKLNE